MHRTALKFKGSFQEGLGGSDRQKAQREPVVSTCSPEVQLHPGLHQ